MLQYKDQEIKYALKGSTTNLPGIFLGHNLVWSITWLKPLEMIKEVCQYVYKNKYILTLSLILRTSIISIPISTTFTLSVKGNSNFEYDFGRHRFLLGASAHMCSLDLTPRFIRSWAFKSWQFNFQFFSFQQNYKLHYLLEILPRTWMYYPRLWGSTYCDGGEYPY